MCRHGLSSQVNFHRFQPDIVFDPLSYIGVLILLLLFPIFFRIFNLINDLTTQVHSWSVELLNRFKNSYPEASTSIKQLHRIIKLPNTYAQNVFTITNIIINKQLVTYKFMFKIILPAARWYDDCFHSMAGDEIKHIVWEKFLIWTSLVLDNAIVLNNFLEFQGLLANIINSLEKSK